MDYRGVCGTDAPLWHAIPKYKESSFEEDNDWPNGYEAHQSWINKFF